MAFERLLGENEISAGCPVSRRASVRGIVFMGEQVLMLQDEQGTFLFPGGTIRREEQPEQAVLCKVAEETGYPHISAGNLAGRIIQTAKDFNSEGSYFQEESFYYYITLKDLTNSGGNSNESDTVQKRIPVFVSIDEAIRGNIQRLKSQSDSAASRLAADTLVLKKVKRIRGHVTRVFFVRHAEPVHSWEDNRTRPLSEEGLKDRAFLREILQYVDIDYVVSSPYTRSVDTIKEYSDEIGQEIHTDERLRERDSMPGGCTKEWIRKRWDDFRLSEEGGESLAAVQYRNLSALTDILEQHIGENVLIGTHGTALGTILNFYHSDFGYRDFFRMENLMPYMVRLDFEGTVFLNQKELGYLKKDFHGNHKSQIDSCEHAEKIFDENRMYTYITGYANAHGLAETKRALAFAKQMHKGQFRKGKERIPFIIHPLNMACHALALGITDDAVIAVILLHDVCEDCRVEPSMLPVSERVQAAVSAITFYVKDGETRKEAKARYFETIKTNKEAMIAKIIDRCNNVSSMAYGFSAQRMKEYIAETRQYVLPLIQRVKNQYPEYENQMFLLKYHICSVLGSVEALQGQTEKEGVKNV